MIRWLPAISVALLSCVVVTTGYAEGRPNVRPVFRQLRELKTVCEQILGASLAHLSMGMSGDFEVAIEEGATIVRLGTALFGPRPPAQRKEEIT